MDDKLEEIFVDEVENRRSMEVYDEMVTTMAGSLYSELEKLIGDYGQGAVQGLMPLLVTVLESLETTCAQAREREEQLELVQEDKQRLLIQYERERDGRKRAEERCMEMEDGIEQERKLYKSNLLTMEAQTKNMEMKARSYADLIVGLEEQKAILNKEISSLTHVHAKIVKSYKELRYQRSLSMEAARHSGRSTPLQGLDKKMLLLDFQEAPSSLESVTDNPSSGKPSNDKGAQEEPSPVHTEAVSDTPTDPVPVKEETTDITLEDELQSQNQTEEKGQESPLPMVQTVVDDIISSTPELKLNSELFEQSITVTDPEIEQEETERNNDSLFDEVYKTSPEFISDVDDGADMSGVGNPINALMMENAQLRDAQSEVDMARKSLIARVEELTAEREALKRETESLTQSLSRCEARLRETEQDLQRSRLELDEARKLSREDAEVDIPAAQRKRFTRAEMARVLMERNQYKERLMELQDAVRRTEMLRASKDVQDVQMKKSSFWKVFDRLFSSSGGPQAKMGGGSGASPPPSDRARSTSTVMYPDTQGSAVIRSQSVSFHTHSTSHTDENDAVSLRQKKHEHYRHIRAHIWNVHGRAQLHGWSQPPALGSKVDSQDTAESDVKGFPVLVQLRLLDQKDPSTKLWCATGASTVYPMSKTNMEKLLPSLVWICSGTHSVSEIMVIDASSGNHVMDQFVITNTHVLCVTSVPAFGFDCLEMQQSEDTADFDHSSKGATVWLGTQEGSLFLHSALSNWRHSLQKTQLKDAIHSITHTSNRVIATLGDGTLAIFSRDSDRKWDLENPKVVDLGRPQQSIRCSLAVRNEVWCGYRNRIYVVDPRTAKVKKWFEATTRTESQVRHLAAAGDGVWVSVRLDSILRLFHAQTGQILQELELEPYIQKMMGSSTFGRSMAQVSALSMFCNRLWIGTASGVILTIPFSSEHAGQQSEEEASPQNHMSPGGPYCAMEFAQVCFHGHRDAVRFFACVPGCINTNLSSGGSENTGNSSMLVMSGGEGYINFKIGDEAGDSDEGYGELLQANPRHKRTERSHLIVWQLQT
ncbi:C-Jun-amino-terminal kinase-interacting protein 4-like [Rhinophrynus dorsalis]